MSLRYGSISEVPAHLLRRGAPIERPEQPKRKYKNIPCIVDGKRFDSKLEGRCYIWLKVLKHAGDLLWFIRRPVFELPGGVKYIADFLVVTRKGVLVLDAKGYLNSVSKNKIKQVKEIHGVDVVLWNDKKGSPALERP